MCGEVAPRMVGGLGPLNCLPRSTEVRPDPGTERKEAVTPRGPPAPSRSQTLPSTTTVASAQSTHRRDPRMQKAGDHV